MKQYLFLSPHLDDAILSCGAYIYKLVQKNYKVIIATVFSGSIESKYLSPAARRFNRACKLGDDAMHVRRLEDENVSRFIKAQCIHLNLHECLYRRNKYGQHIYLRDYDIFNTDINIEKDTINKVILTLSNRFKLTDFERIYIPLGIGRHVDHLILRQAVETLCTQILGNIKKINYYEDIPYVCDNRDVRWRTELTKGLEYYSYNISKKQYNIYLDAIFLYKSQMHVLWNNKAQMIRQLTKHYRNGRGKKLTGRFWKR